MKLFRTSYFLLCLLFSFFQAQAKSIRTVVADSVTHIPLASATVFDSRGAVVGVTNSKGMIPAVSLDKYPITVRFLGFKEKIILDSRTDTVLLQEYSTDLPEVVFEEKSRKVLHILAYMREYSTLTNYTDTIFLFREKMVDYMLPPDKKGKFRGWSKPRVLQSKSYYRFTNYWGLDSVGNRCNQHFSWSDWVGIPPASPITDKLIELESGTDTIQGKYSPTEIWRKNNSHLTVDIDVLADTTSRKWVPNLSLFFKDNLDFETFRLRLNYDNVAGDSFFPLDLKGYSFNIESNGRGHEMFMFNRVDKPFFVSTYGEVYVADKEYISIKEAKKWERMKIDSGEFRIYEPEGVPDLQAAILELIERVNAVNISDVRSGIAPDRRLVGRGVVKQDFGQRALQLLKTLTGISRYRMNRNNKKNWDEFRTQRIRKNKEESRENPLLNPAE